MAEFPQARARTEFSHADFRLVRQWGPTTSARVSGSPSLRRWQRVGRTMTLVSARTHVVGLDRIPRTGPVILAANHSSFLDGSLLFGLVERPVSFMVKAEAFAPVGGLTGKILIRGAQVPVRRNQLDPAPVRLALALLDAGGVLGIFPEGTRGDGRVAHARPGVGYLALKTGATVVPVALEDSARMSHRSTLARPRVEIRFGEPLHFDRRASPLPRTDWLAATELIRRHLAELVAVGASGSRQHSAPPLGVTPAQKVDS